LGLTFIVPETTTKPASNQSKTTGTEEEPKGKKEEELSAQEPEENPIRRKRIFKPANKIQFHSAAETCPRGREKLHSRSAECGL
jgi:hypothetical protein